MVNFKSISGFNWDKGNSEKNKNSHGVEDHECEEIFFNHPILVKKDSKHSSVEERASALGITDQGRLLFVVFTIRKNLIRIISARDTNKKEHKIYEESSKT